MHDWHPPCGIVLFYTRYLKQSGEMKGNMIKTKICEMLNIEYPIFQGGMAWVSEACLAAAVSNAGGLGIISAMNAGPDWLHGQIKRCRELTNKPFGVNIMLLSPYVKEVAEVAAQERVPVVTTGAGNPAPYISAWKQAGIKVIPVVPSSSHAKLMERAGADAVVAEGSESGGHIGELTTMALVPQVVDAVSIPVLAAGGIGDGRGIAASLMLGACGVQVGTRFLVARECAIHQNYKNKVISAKDIDSIVTGKRFGHPVRSLKNQFSRDFAQCEFESEITQEKLEQLGVGALRLAALYGDEARGCFMAGQIAGLVNSEQTAAEIIREMFNEAEKLLRGACEWIS